MTTAAAHQAEPEPPERTDPTAAPSIAAAPPGRVLALQRRIGNRAVTALLAREPTPLAPAPAKLASGSYVVVPKIGTIPVNSVSIGATGKTGDQPKITDVTVASDVGPHSDTLFRAIVEGKSLGTVEILFVRDGKTYLKYKLFDATVSSFQVGGSPGGEGKPTETWALHPEKIEVEVKSPGGG